MVGQPAGGGHDSDDGGDDAVADTGWTAAERDVFVGRVREQQEIQTALATARLVTVVGPGGMGKTRLARRAVRAVLGRFHDGARLVELAGVERDGAVASAMVAALDLHSPVGSTPRELLVSALAPRNLLLLVDNCEHVLTELTPLVAELLDRCPGVTVLATSRAPLGVAGEQLRPLGPLPLADDALELLLVRGRAVRPDLSTDANSLAAMLAICEQLDGMPLAIELAAARLRALTAPEILEHLDQRFQLLRAGGRPPAVDASRHRTLASVVEWSYLLLGPAERQLFLQLGVFAGGFELDAAHAVRVACLGGAFDAAIERIETLDLLDALVAQSLVGVSDHQGRSRYSMLETLRQYGAGQCSPALRASLGAAHARYYLEFARAADSRLGGPEQAHWLARLELEHANIASALTWSFGPDGDASVGVALCGALGWFWRVRSHVASGLEWYERALSVADAAATDRVAALIGAAFLDYAAGRQDEGCSRFREAVELAGAVGAVAEQGWAQHGLARMAVDRRDLTAASTHLEASIAAFDRAGDRRGAAYSMFFLGMVHTLASDDRADPCFELAVSVFTELGDSWGLVGAETGRARRAYLLGDLATSARRYGEALARSWELQSRWMGASTLFGLSLVAAKAERWPLFVRLYRAAMDVSDSYGGDAAHLSGPAGPKARRRAEEVLADFADEWAAAEVRTFADATAVGHHGVAALGAGHVGAAPGPAAPAGSLASLPPVAAARLTSREAAVLAQLIAGRSNREIGAALHLSVRTVENHLHRIYAKLGVASRVEAVVLARDGVLPVAAPMRP
ncbi:MAG: ATP-binding protein [Acidimicrobiales bacterium]